MFREVSRGTRWFLLVGAVLAGQAAFQLQVFAEHTDRFFAWTIAAPMTAAFLGGGYLAGTAFVLLARGERAWAHVRTAVVTIGIFSALILAVTLLHRDRFHFGAAGAFPRFAAWYWLAVYLVAPVWIAVAVVARQERQRGDDPPRTVPLPGWLKVVLAGQGLLLVAVGCLLMVVPSWAAPAWPWSLTPLTARAVASWLLAIGIGSWHVVAEGDLLRARTAAATYVVFGLAQFAALARFGDALDWSRPGAWLYVAVLVVITATAGYGLRRAATASAATSSAATSSAATSSAAFEWRRIFRL